MRSRSNFFFTGSLKRESNQKGYRKCKKKFFLFFFFFWVSDPCPTMMGKRERGGKE